MEPTKTKIFLKELKENCIDIKRTVSNLIFSEGGYNLMEPTQQEEEVYLDFSISEPTAEDLIMELKKPVDLIQNRLPTMDNLSFENPFQDLNIFSF